MMTMKAAISAVMLAAMTLGGCVSSYTPTRTVNAEGVRSESTEQTAFNMSEEAWSISSVGLPTGLVLDQEGINQLSHGPHGALSLPGIGGIASPNPIRVAGLEMEFAESTSPNGEGPQFVPQSIKIAELETRPEAVVEATYAGIAVAMTPVFTELYQANRAQFDRAMAAIENVLPALAESITEAVIDSVNPVPMP